MFKSASVWMSTFSAPSSGASPSKPELKRPEGSGGEAALAKAIFSML